MPRSKTLNCKLCRISYLIIISFYFDCEYLEGNYCYFYNPIFLYYQDFISRQKGLSYAPFNE